MALSDLTGIDKTNRQLLIDTITSRMVTREDDITCSAGEQTKTYLDIPGALRDTQALALAAEVLRTHILYNAPGTETMIGGPTTGAIPLVMGVAMMHKYRNYLQWFIVRDKPKAHGLGRMFVGGEPGSGDKVVLTDDVVSSGRSLMETVGIVQATGAQVLSVVPLVDRGNAGAKLFAEIGIPYLPVLTYTDLGLPPLGE